MRLDTSPHPRWWALYFNACIEAQKWLKQFKTMNEAWYACNHRPDWLDWLLAHEVGVFDRGDALNKVISEYYMDRTQNQRFGGRSGYKKLLPLLKTRRVYCRRIKALIHPEGSPYDDPRFKSESEA